MSQSLYDYVAKTNNITQEQVKYIMEKSEDIMPIMILQYGNDLNTISMKMRKYQKNMIKSFQDGKK